MNRVVIWLVAVGVLIAAVATLDRLGILPARYVLAPLLGLLIFSIGRASMRSLRTGASYIPDGPPRPVDLAEERVTYTCGGCGAEALLLVRGTEVAPRHCGERMAERREVRRSTLT